MAAKLLTVLMGPHAHCYRVELPEFSRFTGNTFSLPVCNTGRPI